MSLLHVARVIFFLASYQCGIFKPGHAESSLGSMQQYLRFFIISEK